MTKEAWIRHMESACGFERPSRGGSVDVWRAMIATHRNSGCLECQARMATKRKSATAKAREDAYRLCGLHKVIGDVTGTVYWE